MSKEIISTGEQYEIYFSDEKVALGGLCELFSIEDMTGQEQLPFTD